METTPATKASGIGAGAHGRGQRVLSSSAAIEARLVSPTERPVSLSPLNAIKRRLRAHAKGLHGVLLVVEIDHEIYEILEFRRGHQLAQDRVLGLAGRTPGGVDADEDRLAGLLRLGKCFWSKGLVSVATRHREPGIGGANVAAKTRVRRDSIVILLRSDMAHFVRPKEKMHISQVAVLPIKFRSSAALPAAFGIPRPSAAGIESQRFG